MKLEHTHIEVRQCGCVHFTNEAARVKEFVHPVSLYADVELPVFQDFRGNQLAASALFKVTLSYHF